MSRTTESTLKPIATTLNDWLYQRQSMMVLMNKLIALLYPAPPTHQHGLFQLEQSLSEFCLSLVHYIETGQISVLPSWVQCQSQGHCEPVMDKASSEALDTSAAMSVAFCHLYMNGPIDQKLKSDLSALSEVLAKRFDIEDALVRQAASIHEPDKLAS